MAHEEYKKVIADWADSPEGQRELTATAERVRTIVAEIKKAAKPRPEDLQKRTTI